MTPATPLSTTIVHLAHGVQSPGAYLGLGQVTATVTDGQPSDVSVTLEGVGEGAVTGSVIGDDSASWRVWLHPSGTHLAAALGDNIGPGLWVAAPDHADFDLYVRARGAAFDWQDERAGLRPGDTITVTPRRAPQLLSPAAGQARLASRSGWRRARAAA